MLKMDRRDDGNATAQNRVRDLEGLAFKQIEEVYDPTGMARDLFEGLLDERPGHRVAEVAEPHRKQKGVVQQTRFDSIDELQEQPRPPVSPLFVQLGGFTVSEVVVVPAVLGWHSTVDVQMPLHDKGIIRLRCPWWWRLRVCWASSVAARHLPDLGELICEDRDVVLIVTDSQ